MLANAPAYAAEVGDLLNVPYQPAHYAVRVNGKLVSHRASVFLGDDDVVFVSVADLDAWRLKHPPEPSYARHGVAYFGLQTDLHLNTSFDAATREVIVTAPSSAFVSTADPQEQQRGEFLDYTLTSEYASYGFFDAGRGGVYEASYINGWNGANQGLFPSVVRWHRVNEASHTAISLGENTSDGDWLGIDAPFAGVHYASDFTGAARYQPNIAPSVHGVAASPSRLEVYLGGLLLVREDVPSGPFVVRDLPEEAADHDLTLVLIDAQGRRTADVVRASSDAQFLGRGVSQFSIDAGVAHENLDAPHQYYRGGVVQSTLKYGLTDRVILDLLGESIAGEKFVSAGTDVQFGRDADGGFRIGGGNGRHAGEYRLHAGNERVSFNAMLDYNALGASPIVGFDDGVTEQINEFASVRMNLDSNWSAALEFQRMRSSLGTNIAAIALDLDRSMGPVSVRVSPFYDALEHRMSANMSFDLHLHERSDPNDPLSVRTSVSGGDSHDEELALDYDAHWATVQYRLQEWNGTILSEPYLHGALVHSGSQTYATRAPDDAESLGIVTIPEKPKAPCQEAGKRPPESRERRISDEDSSDTARACAGRDRDSAKRSSPAEPSPLPERQPLGSPAPR